MRQGGEFFGRLTLRRVMKYESGSERFRVPKTSFQENVLVNEAVSASSFKNKWAVSLFAEWQRLRQVKVPVLDSGGLFKDYDFHKVSAVSKGYCPGTRGYVIYSPRGVPEGVARGHTTRRIYHISPRERSITCLFFRLVRIPNRDKDLK